MKPLNSIVLCVIVIALLASRSDVPRSPAIESPPADNPAAEVSNEATTKVESIEVRPASPQPVSTFTQRTVNVPGYGSFLVPDVTGPDGQKAVVIAIDGQSIRPANRAGIGHPNNTGTCQIDPRTGRRINCPILPSRTTR